MAEKTLADYEAAFKAAPKGSAESNKAFAEWKKAANAPEPVVAAPKKRGGRKSK